MCLCVPYLPVFLRRPLRASPSFNPHPTLLGLRLRAEGGRHGTLCSLPEHHGLDRGRDKRGANSHGHRYGEAECPEGLYALVNNAGTLS